jgi:hypothetical protein
VKPTPLQWFWLIGSGVFFVLLLADVFGFWGFPNGAMVITGLVLFGISMVAGPSFADLMRYKKRG